MLNRKAEDEMRNSRKLAVILVMSVILLISGSMAFACRGTPGCPGVWNYSYLGGGQHSGWCNTCGWHIDSEWCCQDGVRCYNSVNGHVQHCIYCRTASAEDPHQYTNVADGSSGHHRHCSICNGNYAYGAHTYNTDGVCSICGYRGGQAPLILDCPPSDQSLQ